MPENIVEIGDTVTITTHGITKKDWASIGIDEDTEFTVVEIDREQTSFGPVLVTLTDEEGEEYIISSDELIFV